MTDPLPPSPVEPTAVFKAGVAAALALLATMLLGWGVWAVIATTYLALAMALITLTDLRHFLIPDVLSLPSIPLGLLANVMVLHEGNWRDGLADGLTGAALAFGFLFFLRAAYFRWRGVEGLGLGDVKLAAVAGAWLGPDDLAPACLASALAALAATLISRARDDRTATRAKQQIPFGSFIAPVVFFLWVWIAGGEALFRWKFLLMR